jgi:hypothetical protein
MDTWAELTDKEIIEIRKNTRTSSFEPWSETLAFARAILQAAKEKANDQ